MSRKPYVHLSSHFPSIVGFKLFGERQKYGYSRSGSDAVVDPPLVGEEYQKSIFVFNKKEDSVV